MWKRVLCFHELFQNVLNGFEQFCCAVLAGVVDESYARELRGTRVIDAYFGYRVFIERLRREQEEEAARMQPGNGPRPFKSKIFIELQRLALQSHEMRVAELEKQAQEVRESDAKSAAARRQWLDLQGVRGILKSDQPPIDSYRG